MTWRFALLLALAVRASACSCSGDWPSVKQAWEKAPFVFLGTVEMADPDQDAYQTTFEQQSVRIRVDEAFKGVSNGQAIRLQQAGTDCDAKFRTGQRAVFYLYRGNALGSWRVPWCTHALGNAESGGDDLLFLRGLPKSAQGTRLSGEVELYGDSPAQAFTRIGGLPNVRVRISGPRGFKQETVTNAAGAYEVFGLRPGRYAVHIEVPNGLKTEFAMAAGSQRVQKDDAAVELASNGGASVSFVLQADTRLSGRILDANGAPMANVCIDLEPVEGREEHGARYFDCSKADGHFEMEMMSPGKYFLVARDEVMVDSFKSKSTLYYPGVRDREQAAIVSIEASKYGKNLEIRIPAKETRYSVAGNVLFADGAPGRGVTVTFTSPEHGYTETSQAGSDGSFALPVITGMKGQLNAQTIVPAFMLGLCPEYQDGPRKDGLHVVSAGSIFVSSESDHEGLKFEMSSRSCKFWPPSQK
jgi:hypothetical protein